MSDNDRYVVRHGHDWAVKGANAQRASGLYDPSLAEHAAKEIVRSRRCEAASRAAMANGATPTRQAQA